MIRYGFYKPPTARQLKESIDRACNTDIIDIVITGDFNCNMTQRIPNKISKLISEYNLRQLISENRYFTEHSSSFLDRILVRKNESILMSGVIDPLIPEQVRYHCPSMMLLKFTHPCATSYKRNIWSYKLADYNKNRKLFRKHNTIQCQYRSEYQRHYRRHRLGC